MPTPMYVNDADQYWALRNAGWSDDQIRGVYAAANDPMQRIIDNEAAIRQAMRQQTPEGQSLGARDIQLVNPATGQPMTARIIDPNAPVTPFPQRRAARARTSDSANAQRAAQRQTAAQQPVQTQPQTVAQQPVQTQPQTVAQQPVQTQQQAATQQPVQAPQQTAAQQPVQAQRQPAPYVAPDAALPATQVLYAPQVESDLMRAVLEEQQRSRAAYEAAQNDPAYLAEQQRLARLLDPPAPYEVDISPTVVRDINGAPTMTNELVPEFASPADYGRYQERYQIPLDEEIERQRAADFAMFHEQGGVPQPAPYVAPDSALSATQALYDRNVIAQAMESRLYQEIMSRINALLGY